MKNVQKFQDKYGIEVRVDSEGWEDVRPKAAVAANTGAGPDIILSTNDDANLYPEKLVDVTRRLQLPGQQVRRLVPGVRPVPASRTARSGSACRSAWPACAWSTAQSHDEGRGLRQRFRRTPMASSSSAKALKEKGTPPGFALGNATGDGNTWCQWLVWSFGGKLVDAKNKVVINSPETIKALEYAKELYATFVPGTLSWLDPNNNKAFLDGQISLTNNGISVYYAAKNSQDPKVKEMAADIFHANMPVGPIGRPTEFQLFFNQLIFKYSKYPKAAKEFLRFMMEPEQMDPWVQSGDRVRDAGAALLREESRSGPSDPKHTPYRDSMKNMMPSGYAGKMGYASAGALADFIIVNMVAEAASGSKTPKEAAERAQKRAERYYKV